MGWLVNGYLNYISSYSRMVSVGTTPYDDDGLSQVRGKDSNPQYSSVNAIEMEDDEEGIV